MKNLSNMSEVSATPRPAPAPYTTVDIGADTGFHTYILDRDGRKIGVVWGPTAEKVWTAALFAAAPEMLAALKRLISLDGDCDHVDGEPTRCPGLDGPGKEMCHWCEARAAITKAEGEP